MAATCGAQGSKADGRGCTVILEEAQHWLKDRRENAPCPGRESLMRASVLKGSGDSTSLPQRGQLGQGRGVVHLTRRPDISTLFAELRRKRSNRGICSCATVERCEPWGRWEVACILRGFVQSLPEIGRTAMRTARARHTWAGCPTREGTAKLDQKQHNYKQYHSANCHLA